MMLPLAGRLSVHLLLLQLGVFYSTASTVPTLRGVQPEFAASYSPIKDGKFKCLDDSKVIPFGQVNDGYCDCFDGSDEPGTAACPNGHFFCANLGFESKLLNSSFVDDGVCDCCDGSDEPPGECPENRCKELGLSALTALASELADAESGFKTRSKYIKAAISARLSWSARIQEIEEVEPNAERRSKDANAARDLLVTQLNRLQTKMKKMEEDLKPDPMSQVSDESKESTGPLQVEDFQMGEENSAVPETKDADKAEVSESSEDLARRVASQWIPGSSENQEERKEDAVEDSPSDYSTHDEDTTWEDDEDEDDDDDDAVHAGVNDDDDDSENDDDGDDANNDVEAAKSSTPTEEQVVDEAGDTDFDLGFSDRVTSWAVGIWAVISGKGKNAKTLEQARASAQSLEHRVDVARKHASEASEALDSLRTELADLQRKTLLTYGPDDAYVTLGEHCVEGMMDKYTYRVCPFKRAEQLDNGRETSLGNWEGFDDTMENMKFVGGEQCWQGPERSMTVRLKCGTAEALARVAEPNRCEYTAELTTPAACSAGHVAALRAAFAAKQSLLSALKDEL